MIWIAIIISLFVGYLIGVTKVRNTDKYYSHCILSSDDCEENARRVGRFLKARNAVYGRMVIGEERMAWDKTYGKITKDAVYGPQDCTGVGGCSWLPNFIRLVDLMQCRLIIVDKKNAEYVITNYTPGAWPPVEPASSEEPADTEADPE